jgi:hypothetical protein
MVHDIGLAVVQEFDTTQNYTVKGHVANLTRSDDIGWLTPRAAMARNRLYAIQGGEQIRSPYCPIIVQSFSESLVNSGKTGSKIEEWVDFSNSNGNDQGSVEFYSDGKTPIDRKALLAHLITEGLFSFESQAGSELRIDSNRANLLLNSARSRLTYSEWEDVKGKLNQPFFGINIAEAWMAGVQDPESLEDLLDSVGLTDEVIEARSDIWNYVSSLELNDVISRNESFRIEYEVGDRWLLKFNDDYQRAVIESAANFYLSGEFDFIAPGLRAEPVKIGSMWATIQKDVSKKMQGSPGLDYWIYAVALFHRDAKKILEENGVRTSKSKLWGEDKIISYHDRGKKFHNLRLDLVRWDEDVAFFESAENLVVGHTDNKRANRVGLFMVDLESLAEVHPAIDIAPLLMDYEIPVENWVGFAIKYLHAAGFEGSFDQNIKGFMEGLDRARTFMATRTIVGSTIRGSSEKIDKVNANYTRYLH